LNISVINVINLPGNSKILAFIEFNQFQIVANAFSNILYVADGIFDIDVNIFDNQFQIVANAFSNILYVADGILDIDVNIFDIAFIIPLGILTIASTTDLRADNIFVVSKTPP